MNKHLARFLFENSPWPPFLSAWLVGFCEVAFDGQLYLTASGEQYLDAQLGELAALA
jgi:hypothetical protein